MHENYIIYIIYELKSAGWQVRMYVYVKNDRVAGFQRGICRAQTRMMAVPSPLLNVVI